ncbi:hypothetical protein B0A55_12057 [Friedmanniomyces simplex]|uniref:Uncharacterized protein n=1 Tax=Friedmanniomyces simplex TaxID=329884 RepID=A0A4U0WI03_9PEZI|nr:hypothetical protein B0A55_12057 [Friedmanniomyces simplex]
MGAQSWVVPVAVLAAIVGVGLIFIWWWFPRAWKKGEQSDRDEVNRAAQGPEREAQRLKNREIIERYTRALAIERGEVVDDGERVTAPPPPAYEDSRVPVEERAA